MAEEIASLPLSSVVACFKRGLDTNGANATKSAKVLCDQAAGIFILYLANAANDICTASGRSTISGNDVIKALGEVDLTQFAEPAREAFAAFKASKKVKRAIKRPRLSHPSDEPDIDGAVEGAASVFPLGAGAGARLATTTEEEDTHDVAAGGTGTADAADIDGDFGGAEEGDGNADVDTYAGEGDNEQPVGNADVDMGLETQDAHGADGGGDGAEDTLAASDE